MGDERRCRHRARARPGALEDRCGQTNRRVQPGAAEGVDADEADTDPDPYRWASGSFGTAAVGYGMPGTACSADPRSQACRYA